MLKLDELKGMLSTLKDLESQKDKERYNDTIKALRETIQEDTISLFVSFVLTGWRMKDDMTKERMTKERELFIDKANRLVVKWSSSTACKESIKALFDTYDYEAFMERSMSLYYAVKALAYAQYWVAYVKETGISEYPYYNELINMYWWAEKSIWITGDIKNGVFYERMLDGFTIMLPPTLDAIKKEYDTDMQALSVKYGG